ncbi:DUF2637 domain-containing protein [Streptomyces sp. NPDC088337]|uniref:DUF2637 domain-containing protein n=1 Tax=unclassified Streptomyces TaxID=2593676 RepID=UPI0038058DB6
MSPNGDRIHLTPLQRRLVIAVAGGAAVIALIGFIGSYAAVSALAEAKYFGQFATLFPIGLDAGILVLLALDLLLTWLRMPLPLLRHIAWLLTAATIAFNGAAAWPDPIGVGMHAVMPVLFVAIVEAARHAIGVTADINAAKHMESVRLSRWLLAPVRTFFLWRRMKLWELRSYDEVIRLEQSRLVERVRLRKRYGWRWRSKAPVKVVIAYRLTRYGRPLTPVAVDAAPLPEAEYAGEYDPAWDESAPFDDPMWEGSAPALAPALQPQLRLPAAPAARETDARLHSASLDFETAAATALAVAQPQPDASAAVAGPDADADADDAATAPDALVLDLAPMLPLQPGHPVLPPAPDAQPSQVASDAAAPSTRAAAPAKNRRPVSQLRTPDADAQYLEQARELNTKSLREDGQKAPLRLLQRELGIGQRRAQRIQAQLPDTLTPAAAAAQPGAREA